MTKYYIKAYFGDWKEVTKEKADEYIQRKLYETNFLKEESKAALIRRHYKEVKE